ncbi:hypothetical protein GCM10025738_08830 [Microbacterium fluvii]
MARRLVATGFRPDVLLASTAVRAQSTAAAFADALGLAVTSDEELYGAPASVLLEVAAATGLGSVMVVAHDPGMTVLAERLSDGGISHMPTCAVARFMWAASNWDVATALDPDRWEFDAPGIG